MPSSAPNPAPLSRSGRQFCVPLRPSDTTSATRTGTSMTSTVWL